MFTVCPKCALTLVVTAADLRVAQGYVRCGRCLNVFNALARLSEERAPSPPPEATAVEPSADTEPPQSVAPRPAPPRSTAPESPPEQSPAPQSPTPQQPTPQFSQPRSASASPPSAATEAAQAPPMTGVAAALEDTGEIEMELDPSVIVTAARPPTPYQDTSAELHVDVVAEPAETAAAASSASIASSTPTAQASASGQPTAVTPDSVTQPAEQPSTEQQTVEESSRADEPGAQHANTAQPGLDDSFDLAARRPRAPLAWIIGAAALAVALALQVVNHYRDALAAASPALRGPLTTIYSALGIKLAPRWNIHAYDVRQLGASVARAGEIIVRASVKNTAKSAQPMPLLRVTLQDRFSNRIASRDVAPADYLPSSVVSSAPLPAGSRVDATMVFVDPGPLAVGFEIDACLRRQNGEVACAHGP